MALIDDVIRDFTDELRILTTGMRSAGDAGDAFSNQIGKAASTAFNLFAMRFPIASAAIAELGKVAGASITAITNLANTAQDGAASISGVTGALSSLPYGLGELAKYATMAAQVLEKNIATQENLAKSGANFSGNLDLVRQSAGRSYLSLDQFGAVVGKNADVLSTMGGDVQKGANRFVAIQNSLLAPDSPTSKNLATLGYSFQDAANLTASYMRSQGNMNKSGLEDTKKVSAAVAQYGRELDVLSKLTGESREAIQQKLDAENQEAQWQAYMAELGPEQAAKMNQGIKMAMVQGGQGAVDAFKAMSMGFPPMTEAAQLYTATQRSGVAALDQYNKNARDAGISTEENAKRNAKILAQQIAQGGQDRKQLQEVLRADALAGGNLSKSFADATKMQTKFNGMSEQQIATELERMNIEAARADSQAAEGKKQQQVMMDLTNRILAGVLPALNFLLDMTLKVGEFFGSFFTVKDSDFYKSYIQPVLDKMFGAFSMFGIDGEKFSRLFGNLKNIFGELGKQILNVFDIVGTIINVISRVIGPPLTLIGEVLLDAFNNFVRILSGITQIITGITDLIAGAFSMLTGDFQGGWEKMKEGFKNIVSGFFEKIIFGFVTFFKDTIESFRNFASKIPLIGELYKKEEEKPEGKPEGDKPKLAEGGIVTRATTALIGEGGEPEAVMPLSKLKEFLNTSDLGKTASDAVSSLFNGPSASNDKAFEFLQSELQTLNKQTAEMISYLRNTEENTRRGVDAMNGLSGDMFKF